MFGRKRARILKAITDNPGITGPQLCAATNVSLGSLYPILVRMEVLGEIKSWWGETRPGTIHRSRHYAAPSMVKLEE